MGRDISENRRPSPHKGTVMKIPTGIYRLQFGPSFGFRQAWAVLDYLSDLGVSDVYASPVFRARKGSTHGYDVVDPLQLNPELGTAEEFQELLRKAAELRLGWIQDFVPNHMAYDHDNTILMDILENGPYSKYYEFFDIEWTLPYHEPGQRLLAPFLGRFYGECLEDQEIQLKYDQYGMRFNYYQLMFPLRLESYLDVLTFDINRLKRIIGDTHPDFIKFLGILYVLKTISTHDEVDERYTQIQFIKRLLYELYANNLTIRDHLDRNIRTINGEKGDPESFLHLENLLAEQHFRLSFWKVATEEINYRRFFNINELICLRIENDEVFKHVHGLLLDLIDSGRITGVRIDHIDGLYDPSSYLKRLRSRIGDAYLVVEKILEQEERLPEFWPVQGTTGYDFLNHVNGVFCHSRNEKRFTGVYARFTPHPLSFPHLVYEKKRLIVRKEMAGDVDDLATLLKGISGRYRHGSDITLQGLKSAIVELMCHFPVYRTYINAAHSPEQDKEIIKKAVQKAMENNAALLYELDFLEKFLTLTFGEYFSDDEKNKWLHFAMRFQQFTGPLMAKSFEDTLLYCYNRLLSLNDVGGNPGVFGISLERFHQFNIGRLEQWPYTMNATSTHDTKRSEDVRARIHVLSEIPSEWSQQLKKWGAFAARKKKTVHGAKAPDRNDEYAFYQNLLGAYPLEGKASREFVERMKEYVIKAVREAKVHTAWLKPDSEYEQAFLNFLDKLLDEREDNPFLKEFQPFQAKISFYGMLNSLSQTLLKSTCPGIPDVYQGTELWDLSLVDPDNRRPVDFELRRRHLKELMRGAETDLLELIETVLAHPDDGRIKMFLIHRVLSARRERPELFLQGAYLPIEAQGAKAGHIIAFARNYGGEMAVTAAPRFCTALVESGDFPLGPRVWEDTELVLSGGPPSRWRDAITGRIVLHKHPLPVSDVLTHFPVALLLSE